MKFSFKQTYTFPVSIASAVAVYLDCEHYIFLHNSCEKKYKTLSADSTKCVSEIYYKSGFFSWIQKSTTEYIGTSELIQYDISIKGIGPAILANFLNVKTRLRYFQNNRDCEVEDINNDFKIIKIKGDNNIVLSEIKYDLDIPFFIYPFRNILKNRLINMKRVKDLEDYYMIKKRIKLFGSDYPVERSTPYWAPYFKDSYFLLFKDKFINNFFKAVV